MNNQNFETPEKIIASLPEEQRRILEEERKQYFEAAKKTAGISVMIRNFSHNTGSNVIPKTSETIEVENEKNIEEAKALAENIVRSMNPKTYPNPEDALKNFPWNFDTDIEAIQKETAERNLKLDGRSCLGRTAQSAALVELQFPNSVVKYGEVLSDHLRRDMLAQVNENLPSDKKLRDEWLKEVLMYEEPHAVIIVDGKQFDPLSTVYPVEINHPKIQAYPLWEGVASAMKISEAWLEEDPIEKLKILELAEKLCPGTTTVAENMAGAYVLLGREEEATNLMKELLIKRPNARALYFLWISTGDEQYRKRLDDEYTPYMHEVLKQETGI